MRRNWIWIFPFFVAATIVWLSSRSSYPFDVSLPPPFDKLAHMAAFGVLAGFTEIALRRTHPDMPVVRRLSVILIGVAIFGASDEIHQYFVPGRSCDLYDWMADVAGGALGLGLASLVKKLVSVILIPTNREKATMKPTEIIPRFDAFLVERSLTLEAIATGGAALALLGIISRETRDCDLIEPELSSVLLEASRAFATGLREQGEILRDDWLNNGPASLGPLLPEGWRSRLQLIHQGEAIRLWSLGRPELLLSKLFALCDRGLDLGDCLALAPTAEELAQGETWIAAQDLHPDWPAHVKATLEDLARRLGHGL